MLSSAMPARAPKKPAAKPRATPSKRKLSALTEIGERAKHEAMRRALLAELRRQDWNLSATADALTMGSASNVLRAVESLGLQAEYEAAKAAGKIPMGRRG